MKFAQYAVGISQLFCCGFWVAINQDANAFVAAPFVRDFLSSSSPELPYSNRKQPKKLLIPVRFL